jgi:hypothetical protein
MALLVLMPCPGFATPPNPADPLEGFRQTQAIEFRYRETRHLELLAKPWQGAGYLFSTPDGKLIKLQLSPERVVMAISGDRMYYYDYLRGERHSAPLAQAGAMAQQVGIFRAILQGRSDELRAGYELRTESGNKNWTLRLIGKTPLDANSRPAFEISGGRNPARRVIAIRQPDGEKTDYVLEQAAVGKHLETWIEQLVQEARGD